MKNDVTCSRFRRALLLALAVGLLPTGALAQRKKDKKDAKPANLVWPLPPEKPRIKFVGAIYGAADVEPRKKAGFLDRLAGIHVKDLKPGFLKPYGVSTDSRGRIYVVDSGQAIVFVLDPAEKKVTYIGRSPQVRLRVPIGIAVDAQDRVWVADAVGQHVYAFDAEGNVVMALGKTGEMENPTSVAVDNSRQRLYVVDSKQHAVLAYDSANGQFLSRIGKRGSEPGEFNFPTNVAVDRAGRLYVTDTMNFRVQVFDAEGKFADTFGKQGNRFGQFLKPKGIALDAHDNIYVVDSDFDNFQIFDQQKRLLMFLGSVGSAPGAFWLPADIHVDAQNRIYISDQNNRRIQIFQLLDGLTTEADAAPRASTAKPEGKGGDPVTKPQKN